MSTRDHSNLFVTTTLASAAAAGAGTLILADAVTTDLSVPFALVVDIGSVTSEEVFLVTVLDGTRKICTVTPGYDGTTPKPHAAGASVSHTAIAADFNDAQSLLAYQNANTVYAGPASGAPATPAFRAVVRDDLPPELAYEDEANVFTPSQIIRGHSAIGPAGVVPDEPDVYGDDWQSLLNVSWAPVGGYLTDLSNGGVFGLASAVRSVNNLNITAPADRGFTIFDGEVHLFGDQNYVSSEGFVGAVIIEPSFTGNAGSIFGVDFIVSNKGGTTDYAAGASISAAALFSSQVSTLIGSDVNAYCFLGGTAVTLIGSQATIFVDDTDGGGVNTATGIRVSNSGISGAGTLYGLYMDSMIGADTTNYSVYTNDGPVRFGDYLELPEITTPLAASANTGRLFVQDNGAGKSQLAIRFPSGAIQVIATEP